MDIQGSPEDFEAILAEDYLVRYWACNRLLQANGLALEITDLRGVFSQIAADAEPMTDVARRRREKAREGLVRAIRWLVGPREYAGLTAAEITGRFLDACFRVSQKPDLALLTELTSRGADVRAHDETGIPAFFHATRVYDREVMAFFLARGADLNEVIRFTDGNTSTVWLEKAGYAGVEDLRLMLAHGARATDRDSAGNTVLMRYCRGNPTREGVALLLGAGAEATGVNAEGDSALHLIARTGADGDAVRLLLEAGAEVNRPNGLGDTPLHLNSRFTLAGDETIAAALLEHGANPDLLTPDGDTPLLLATRCEKERVVRVLLERGARRDIRDAKGKTAYEIALEKGFVAVARHLDPRAAADHAALAARTGVDGIKAQIITRLQAGGQISRGNKEGYSVFRWNEGVFQDEWFENGAPPPDVTVFPTVAAALEHLYATNRTYAADETEVAVYQRILGSLDRR
ncbi:MAG: hypothetical protein GX442_15410 [Candidatus Riflebacteria bacterium]|nr:hypothetical protein [Candidatus Riflebacteria bacterium]